MARVVRELGQPAFAESLDLGLGVRIGPFNAHISARVDGIADALYRFYGMFPLLPADAVHSFRARVESIRPIPLIRKRNVRFTVDGLMPHEDLPVEQALPALEWGINLVIALRFHSYLMLHTAVVEKHGKAMLMPAAPGFGKSTLCTALVHRGWRLLSDEFGLVRPGSTSFLPVPRPIALKNESIDVIRDFAPDAEIGPNVRGTRKGTVAHVKPPDACVASQAKTASVRWIVFPRWVQGEELSLIPVPKADGFMKLAMNAFNYELLGESGYLTVREIVQRAGCYQLVYSDLDEAVARLSELAEYDEES